MSRFYEIPVYRVTLVRDGEIPVEEEPITTPQQVAAIAAEILADADREVCLTWTSTGTW